MASIFGLSFFLAFMLLAVQLLWSAYATSMVTAAAYDAGRAAARTGDPAAAIERFESSVGGFDADITVSVPAGPAPIVVEVSGRNPTLLPARVASRLPFGTIERTILIRREVFVPHA